jgi:hypothetical protein
MDQIKRALLSSGMSGVYIENRKYMGLMTHKHL